MCLEWCCHLQYQITFSQCWEDNFFFEIDCPRLYHSDDESGKMVKGMGPYMLLKFGQVKVDYLLSFAAVRIRI